MRALTIWPGRVGRREKDSPTARSIAGLQKNVAEIRRLSVPNSGESASRERQSMTSRQQTAALVIVGTAIGQRESYSQELAL
jgi:hypothetical protein